ncbi:hypothetical protein EDD11_002098 [Mortierella claussenii]|nr:hypothetical protein EDD11_002098 [Mortierella claussenii]
MTASLEKLRNVENLEVNRFCDFVCYIKAESGSNKVILVMTDYTENPQLPIVEGQGRVGGRSTILVTLWDEHSTEAQQKGLAAGQTLYLKNLLCKINRNGVIELNMNGYRGHGWKQIDPITVLHPKDPLARDLRLRRSQHMQGEDGTPGSAYAKLSARSGITTAAALAAREQSKEKEEAPSTSTFVTPSTPANVASSSSEYPSLPGQAPSVSRNISTPAHSPARVAPKHEEKLPVKMEPATPSPPPSSFRATTPVARTSTPMAPTRLLAERVQQELKESGQNGVQFLKMNVRVTGFEPKLIMDFSFASCSHCSFKYRPISDSKLPSTCPSCHRGGSVVFKYAFMLKVMDEFQQTYNVHIDNDSAKTLLGSHLADAGNLNKAVDRLAKLKKRLGRIGVVQPEQRKEKSLQQHDGPPIFFDAFIKLIRVGSERLQFHYEQEQELNEHHGQQDDNDVWPLSQDDQEAIDGDVPEGDLFSPSLSTQPFQSQAVGSSHKRRMDRDQIREGKRPCGVNDRAVPVPAKVGLVLQGPETDETPADFKAYLVHTAIN